MSEPRQKGGNNAQGRFVVLEGGDGSGKTTIIEFLKERFPSPQFSGVFTREPGGTVVADEIRAVLLKRRDNEEGIEPETEILLFEASRAEHLQKVVRPALVANQLVVTDRFDSSTFAYEIYGNQRFDLMPFFEQVNGLVVGETVPDLYIYLDVDPEIGAQRRRLRNGETDDTRYDAMALQYHQSVHEGYLDFFKRFRSDRHVLIDANLPLEQVEQAVAEAIEALL